MAGSNETRSPAITPLAVGRRELAALLCIGTRTLDRLGSSGQIGPRAITLGGSKRWVIGGKNGVRAWLQAGAPGRDSWPPAEGGQDGC